MSSAARKPARVVSLAKASTSASASSSRTSSPARASSPSDAADGVDDAGSDDDDEGAWDEVDIAAVDPTVRGLDIVISKQQGSLKNQTKSGAPKRKPPTPEQRMIRQETHKLHTICLLAAGLIRNRTLNDAELHARLLSQVPLDVAESFHAYSVVTHPSETDRSRLFDSAVKALVGWWWSTFQVFDGRGIARHPGIKLFEDPVEDDAEATGSVGDKNKGKGKRPALVFTPARTTAGYAAAESITAALSSKSGEWIKSIQSMRKHATMLAGSRDMSAQLFTALCRAFDIPSRLVFSLQPVDWKTPAIAAPGKKSRARPAVKGGRISGTAKSPGIAKGKGKAVIEISSSEEEEGEYYSDGGKRPPKQDRSIATASRPAVNLRKTKLKKQVERSASPPEEDATRPPVFWTEVYSRSRREWIAVDVVRKKMRCRGAMEPARNIKDNVLLYAVAYEEDDTMRDVTMRYAKRYTSFTLRARVPSRKGTDWFERTLAPYTRSFKLNRDNAEDQELRGYISNEAMPTSVAAYKDHPNYVLQRHLKQDEAVRSGEQPIAAFTGSKGTATPEPIYSRSSIVIVKSKENYMKVGLRIKENEIPLKWGKARNVTINRKRAQAAREADGLEAEGKPLYSENQTELWISEPIVDGKIPKNEFGNIDLYVPSMLPDGGVHMPQKLAASCAKKLEIPYAEAVTGFEFRQGRAFPVLTGIVIPLEFQEIIEAAIEDSERIADDKAFNKMQERVLKHWRKLILGLRTRQRLQMENKAADKAIGFVPIRQESQLGKTPAPEVKTEQLDPAAASFKIRIPAKPRAAPSPSSLLKTNGRCENLEPTSAGSRPLVVANGKKRKASDEGPVAALPAVDVPASIVEELDMVMVKEEEDSDSSLEYVE